VGNSIQKVRCTLRRGDRRIFRVNGSTSYSSRQCRTKFICEVHWRFSLGCLLRSRDEPRYVYFSSFYSARVLSFHFISNLLCRSACRRAYACGCVDEGDGVHLKRPKTCSGGRAHTHNHARRHQRNIAAPQFPHTAPASLKTPHYTHIECGLRPRTRCKRNLRLER